MEGGTPPPWEKDKRVAQVHVGAGSMRAGRQGKCPSSGPKSKKNLAFLSFPNSP